LLADDSVTAQNMGRRILTDAGYEVITVNNGSAALKKIHENRPDLIVLDVYMPGYGGLEVCQRLKESDATMKIPVLLTVGKMEPFKAEEAKRVRADGHIVKPFDASELLAALTKLEDRIVPTSETVRARKPESKKSRASNRHDPVADFSNPPTEQITYLQQEKNREAVSAPEVPVEASAVESTESAAMRRNTREVVASERGAEPFARRDSQIPTAIEEAPAEAVTFAAGPIFEAYSQPVESAKTTHEPTSVEAVGREVQAEEIAEPAVSSGLETNESVAAQVSESSGTGSFETSATSIVPVEPEPQEAKIAATPRWMAENVTLSADEASVSLEEEMRRAQGSDSADVALQEQGTSPEASPERSETHHQSSSRLTEPDSQSGAAFAAAASASDSSAQVEAFARARNADSTENSEAAVVWENWQRIRDSVVTPQTTEAIAQSVAQSVQENVSVANEISSQAAAEIPSEPAEQGASGDVISSIVDNVLAELKPRLLAEIAKQLAGDKK
jgi:CheY-like chemotaxis protein